MLAHAGTVIGGSVERSGPHVPACISFAKFGKSGRYRSKTSLGAAQSKPIKSSRAIRAASSTS